MKIAVAGTGYVGLSIAVSLAQKHKVWAVDILPEKVKMINQGKSPIVDKEIEAYLATNELNLHATVDAAKAYEGAEFIVISTPTNYDPEKNFFDTSSVESVIKQVLEVNPEATMVIKSTIPVGFTESVCAKYQCQNILFHRSFCEIVGVYEPTLKEEEFFRSRVIRDLDEFKKISDVITGVCV